jgi:ATP-binding cassette, subfamily B, bacterial
LRGEFTIGDLTFLSGSFRRLRNLLEGLLIGFSQVAGAALYLDDLFSFFEIRPEIVSPPNPKPFPNPMRDGFRFENVGFRYPGAERWAVRNLDFTLRASEVLALVGENGAGKTTLVKLLAVFTIPMRDAFEAAETHEELLVQWARYAEVCELQVVGYR